VSEFCRLQTSVPHAVTFTPPEIITRRSAIWTGLAAEYVELTHHAHFQYGMSAPCHLLIASERGERYDGETSIEGLPRSTLRNFSGKLTFVPAGHKFDGWQKPRALSRVIYLYLDPALPLVPSSEYPFEASSLKPRLFFEDKALWQTALKLKAQITNTNTSNRLYVDALNIALLHELLIANGKTPTDAVSHGGLAGWQERRVIEYIESNLNQPISLSELAAIARLSPFHFARAFKHSVGLPPHHYHRARRIERAKAMLAMPERSVTEVALSLGFSETSSFTAAFRKTTGHTPTAYRRQMI